MPSTHSPLLRIELQSSGENDSTWGDKTNTNMQDIVEASIAGMTTISMSDANYTLSVAFGAADEARSAIIKATGTLTATRQLIVPTSSKVYVITNATVGGFPITVKPVAGTGVQVVAGTTSIVYCDGTNVVSAASPQADSSVTPSKIDTTTTNAWRFDNAIGVGRTQAYTSGFGAMALDGATGSFVNLYRGGVQYGSMNVSTTGFSLEAGVGQTMTFKTGNTTRLAITSSGSAAFSQDLAAASFSATGVISGGTIASAGNMSCLGTMVSQGGYVGLTSAQVQTALNYTPIQQGTGTGQTSTTNIKIGYNSTLGRLTGYAENTALGSFVFEGTQGIFVPVTGQLGTVDFASNSAGRGASGAAVVIRELNRGGAQGGSGSLTADPRISFIWSGYTSAQILMSNDGNINFMNGFGLGLTTVAAAVYTTSSDMRLKDKLLPIRHARDKLMQLEGFYYKNSALARDMGMKDSRVQIGFSAQEVEKVFPDLVREDTRGYKQLMYDRMTAVLVEGFKEQDEQIETLKQTVAALLERVAALEDK